MTNMLQLLTSNFQVSQVDLDKALSYQSRYGGKIEQILVNLGSLPEDQIAKLYSEYLDFPLIDSDKVNDWELPEVSNEDLKFLLLHQWIPLAIDRNSNSWQFATKDPLSIDINQWITKHQIVPEIFIASEADFMSLSLKTGDSEEDFDLVTDDEEARLKEMATEAPTINLLNSLISRGLRKGASDMHLEPYQGRYRVRYRIDGVLHDAELLSARMEMPIVTRLKILSGMDIAEKRRPQDGKIELKVANQELDIRVSALPLNMGESMVLRFLRKESIRYDMKVLGLSDDVEQLITEDLRKTAGVILLTGPTGSGKTTTLYTFLNALNTEDVKIISLEDPVEYQLEGVNQVQVNSEIGFDFAAGLRSVVRQDPDVIMLGEIRDHETAQIALQSALTGHLVFSTVHTNDVASAYTRLLDLGIEEFLLNAALVSIIAQRLARTVCTHCAEPDENSEELIKTYDLQDLQSGYGLDKINLVKVVGCKECGNTGYKGRMALTEYLRCDDQIKAMPKDSNFILNARKHNSEIGRRNLYQDGLYKAMQGITTIDEVIRVASNV
jgi:general secretion pathway protein E